MGRKPNLVARQTILDQAEHLIHLKGYHATSMEDIARCCGMTKANLFHHYGSKEDLGLAVLDAKMSDYHAKRVGPGCCPEDPGAAVQRMFDQAAEHYESNDCKAGCFIGNIALEMADSNEAFREKAGGFFKDWTERLAGCLENAGYKGDSKAAAEAVVALYEGAIMLARARRDAEVFKRVGRVARTIVDAKNRR